MASADEYLQLVRRQTAGLPRVFRAELDPEVLQARPSVPFFPAEIRAELSVQDPRFLTTPAWETEFAAQYRHLRTCLGKFGLLVEERSLASSGPALRDLSPPLLAPRSASPPLDDETAEGLQDVVDGSDAPGDGESSPEADDGLGDGVGDELEDGVEDVEMQALPSDEEKTGGGGAGRDSGVPSTAEESAGADFGPFRDAETEFDRRMFAILRGDSERERHRQRTLGDLPITALPEDTLQRVLQAEKALSGVRAQDWVEFCLQLRPVSSPSAASPSSSSSPSSSASSNEQGSLSELPKRLRRKAWKCVRCEGCLCVSGSGGAEQEVWTPELPLLAALDQVQTCQALTCLVEDFFAPALKIPQQQKGSEKNQKKKEKMGQSGGSRDDPTVQGFMDSRDRIWVYCCSVHHPEHSEDTDQHRSEQANGGSETVGGWMWKSEPLLSRRLSSWLYSLLLRLETPLYAEIAALLRSLYRLCAQTRSLQPSMAEESVVSLPSVVSRCNLLMTICDRIFDQHVR